MRSLTHLSLFSGIGGLDLAAEWAGMKTIGQCEWAEYPTKVLERHWPDVPRWKDIRTLTGESFYERTGLRTVDVISGGFPCQPFSVAGKQRGKEDDRYIWPEMVRVIKELRPTWVVGENVAGIVRMVLSDILSELEACGYRTRTFLIPACAVGARHRRYRVAIVGYAEHNGLSATEIERGTEKAGEWQQEGKKTAGKFAGAGKPGNNEDVANSEGKGIRGLSVQQRGSQQKDSDIERSSEDVQHTDGSGCEEQHASCISDQQGFACWGCNEGNVCDTAGKGLPDRTGIQMERPETEQKPERPDRGISDTNRSKTVRREQCQETSGEDAGTRDCNGNREEEHAEWERRATESGLGGVVDGFSDRMDGDFMIDHYWDEEPDIPRIAIGIQNRVGRLKALGNAVVPQQFYPVFKAIEEIERGKIWQQ